jgi:hypothetical protein
MTETKESGRPQSQSDKFKAAAKAAEADPDEKAWEERLKKVAKQKPTEKNG